MSNKLYQRDFLKETDFTPEELTYLLDLAAQLKQAKKARREPKFLADKNIVILFEKDSTRTRCSFEVAAYDQGARITRTENVQEGVKDCDFLSTDVWVSMGEPDSVWKERIELLTPYRVDAAVMEMTGNADCKFLHCLPSFHNRETTVGEDIYQRFGIECMEVSDDVFESPKNMAFEEAENRLHTIKAVMVATMAEEPLVFDA